MHSFALWLAVAFAEPTVEAGTPEVATEAGPAVESAMAELAAGRFEQAAQAFGALAEAGRSADLRYLEALSRYEAGEMRHAESAADRGLALDPEHGALLNLRGLVRADLGRGEEALRDLEKASARARVIGDVSLQGRVALNTGIVWLDLGDLRKASASFEQATRLGAQAGDADLSRRARENTAVVAARRGDSGSLDYVGRVADLLRKGDLDGARAILGTPAGAGRRDVVATHVARAAVERAESRYDEASATLEEALKVARDGGLDRERALILGEMGTVQWLAGRAPLAAEYLRQALEAVEGTSFRVLAIDLHAQAGLVALVTADVERAAGHLATGRELARVAEHPLGVARLDELAAGIAAARGDVEGAQASWTAARKAYEGKSLWMDAARVACAATGALGPRSPEAAATWEAVALSAFAKAGDPLATSHVGIARGLGQARAKDLEGALTSFAKAAEAAEAVGTPRALALARIARSDAADTLRVLGHGEEAARRASELGVTEILARQEMLEHAREEWAAGRVAWEAADYTTARRHFDTAYMGFQELGEAGYSRVARSGRAWALWNEAVAAPVATAHPWYEELVGEALQVEDPELRVRARSALALSAMEISGVDAAPLLKACAEDASSIGMEDLAARCWAGTAEIGPDLLPRAAAARRAHALDPGAVASVYAMYSVAVDAYNIGDYGLAEDLATEVGPVAGDLADAVTAVLEAARRARIGG